jgi:hypothetical protein
MIRMLGLAVAVPLLAGTAATADAQVIPSAGGGVPGVVILAPTAYGTGAIPYGYRSRFGYGSYAATSYARSYAAPVYPLAPTTSYRRGYAGAIPAAPAGTYAPYGGYATPNFDSGFMNLSRSRTNSGMDFYGYGISGP